MTQQELDTIPVLTDAAKLVRFTGRGQATEVFYDSNHHGWLIGTLDGERVRKKFTPVSAHDAPARRCAL